MPSLMWGFGVVTRRIPEYDLQILVNSIILLIKSNVHEGKSVGKFHHGVAVYGCASLAM